VLFIFVSFFLTGVVSAQNEDEALFRKGLAEYRQEQYAAARDDFRRIIEKHIDSPRFQAAQVMLAKALYRIGAFSAADSIGQKLRNQFPDSRYAEWTFYLESACALRRGNGEHSLRLLAWLAGNARDGMIRARSLRALRYTVIPHCDSDQVSSVLKEYGIERSALNSAEPYGLSDIFEIEDETFSPSAAALSSKESPWRTSPVLRIGLLTPLSGANTEMGNQLLRGVRTAFSDSAYFGEKQVELVVADTFSDPVTAVIKVRELVNQGVSAIIGPVYSISNITAAVEANTHGVPFIAPTATDVGLTDIGSRVFQLNFTPVVQAEALADYAVNTLSVKNVAVIASRDRWGEVLASTFEREIEKKGAKVILTSYFQGDAETEEDVKIVRDIRAHAPKPLTFTDSTSTEPVIASLDSTASDSTYYSSKNLNAIDTVDAVLISATPSDAIRYASRIMEYHIITTLLGDSGWNYPNVPEDGKQYVNGAVLVAPPGELSGGLGPLFMERSIRYDDRDTVMMKGYDAAALLRSCIKSGALEPDGITKALESMKDFRGSSSQITIDPLRRVNTAVEFARIRDQKYERTLFKKGAER
jgi:ABC-type branched-subunit amino acid transport system substrate-binding protein